MKDGSENLYFSIETLRSRITQRFILYLFVALAINLVVSLARIPVMGFQPSMVLHIVLCCVMAVLTLAKRDVRPRTAAFVMVGTLSSLIIFGVATLGLLSVTIIVGPILALYLMLLGFPRFAKLSIATVAAYLAVMAFLFLSDVLELPVSPDVYIHSPAAWIMMIVAVGGVSIAFVAPFELVPTLLEGSEERFRLAFENANVGTCLTGLDGGILKVNNAMCEMLGYQRGELEQMKVAEITHPDDRQMSLDFIARALEGRLAKTSFEERYVSKSGEIVWANIASSLIRDGRGTPQYFITHIQDISKRKQVEEALRESEEKFRSSFMTGTDAFYFATLEEGLIIEANEAMEKMFGYPQAELIGKTSLELHLWHDPADRARMVSELKANGSVKDMEVEGRKKGGEIFTCSISVSIVPTGNERHILGVIRDITTRKRAEESIRRLNRTYAVLSNINQLIVRERDRTRMFEKACQIAVDDGQFRMAWVGLLDESTGKLAPVASAGAAEGYVELLNIEVDNSVYGMGPSGRALQEGRPFVCNDIEHDEYMAPWRERALAHGFHSSGAFPIRNEARTIGAINFYSGDTGYFNDEEIRLLEELAMDLSFALKSLALEADRLHAVGALRKSEELYRLIAANIRDVIWTLDPYTEKFTYMSPSVTRLRGYTAEEIMAAPLRETMTPESYRRIEQILPVQLAAFNRGERTGILQKFELDEPRKDGSIVSTEVVISVLADESGKAREILGVTRDITERKQAEESLIRLNNAVEASGEVVFMTDREGTFTFVNGAFTRVYGYPPEEVVGLLTPRILKSGEQTAEKYRAFWESLLTKRIVRGEWTNRARDGRILAIEGTANPILDGRGNIIGFLAIQRDVTDQRSMEDQMRQAQKMQSIGTLASGIAHDFNNILGIIMGHASLIERFRTEPEKLSKSVATILTASNRGAAVVRQMLTFARKNEVEFKPLLLDDSVAEIVKLLSETFPKTITVVSRPGKSLPVITADVTQLHQVLLNLCVNARDAMNGAGTLTITTMQQSGEGLRARFVKAVHSSYVVLTVSDTGGGMDEETQKRIFEPFFTTKDLGKGTGLGLSVVFGIMESHDGFVDVTSRMGQGTTFALYFPVRSSQLDDAEPVGLRADALLAGTETVLVVEDEESLRNSVRINLSLNGYTVLTAEDGAKALAIYRENWKETAVVVSDFGLPRSDGLQVFRALKAVNPAVKFVLASGYIDAEKKSEIIRDGVRVFLQKPYSIGDLLRKIRDMIDFR